MSAEVAKCLKFTFSQIQCGPVTGKVAFPGWDGKFLISGWDMGTIDGGVASPIQIRSSPIRQCVKGYINPKLHWFHVEVNDADDGERRACDVVKLPRSFHSCLSRVAYVADFTFER